MSTAEAESPVRLRSLAIHQEGGSWIVGRRDSGDFVEVPIQAVTFLRALETSSSVVAAEQRVLDLHGQAIDSSAFLTSLVGLGFVASVGDHVYPDESLDPSLPWIRPRHVRFLFSRPVAVLVGLLWILGLLAAFRRRDLLPSYQSFFVTDWNGLNIAWSTVLYLLTVAVHELAHLAAARSADVHARFALGTRLNMLAAETKVSGLWGAPRAVRFRVYLAGIVSDLCVMATLSILLTTLTLPVFVERTFESLILALFISVATQFALYMRTDMYFVCQELLGCKNLFGDAWAYVHFRRGQGWRRRSAGTAVDPVLALPQREQRFVRLYAWFMLLGSAVSLSVFASYGAPIMIRLYAESFTQVGAGLTGGGLLVLLNGLVVILVEGGLQVLFLLTFFRKHGVQIRAGFRRVVRGSAGR